MKKPLISIVLPVFNAEGYLAESVDSIINQTQEDFELIVVDDGSTDDSLAILLNYSDPRLRIIKLDENGGLVNALNIGFGAASGKYIARMDADDIAFPNRLEKQVRLLEDEPHIGVCGSYVQTFGQTEAVWKVDTEHDAIDAANLLSCKIFHPTAMIRRSILSLPAYDNDFQRAEDYELWSRLLQKGIQFSNFPEALVKYRVHEQNTSNTASEQQIQSRRLVHLRLLDALGVSNQSENIWLHELLAYKNQLTKRETWKIVYWIRALLSANNRTKRYRQSILTRILKERWTSIDSVSERNFLTKQIQNILIHLSFRQYKKGQR